jgi:hypothetical protein
MGAGRAFKVIIYYNGTFVHQHNQALREWRLQCAISWMSVLAYAFQLLNRAPTMHRSGAEDF